MSHYFNIIYVFLTFTTILFFVYLLPVFQKGFFVTVKSVKPCFDVCAYVLFYLFFDTVFSKTLLVNSGDIETNSGPGKSSPINFAIGT